MIKRGDKRTLAEVLGRSPEEEERRRTELTAKVSGQKADRAAKKERRAAKVAALQVQQLDRRAAAKERRALKMSRKIGRGNIRANRAFQQAESLRAAADRKTEENR